MLRGASVLRDRQLERSVPWHLFAISIAHQLELTLRYAFLEERQTLLGLHAENGAFQAVLDVEDAAILREILVGTPIDILALFLFRCHWQAKNCKAKEKAKVEKQNSNIQILWEFLELNVFSLTCVCYL